MDTDFGDDFDTGGSDFDSGGDFDSTDSSFNSMEPSFDSYSDAPDFGAGEDSLGGDLTTNTEYDAPSADTLQGDNPDTFVSAKDDNDTSTMQELVPNDDGDSAAETQSDLDKNSANDDVTPDSGRDVGAISEAGNESDSDQDSGGEVSDSGLDGDGVAETNAGSVAENLDGDGDARQVSNETAQHNDVVDPSLDGDGDANHDAVSDSDSSNDLESEAVNLGLNGDGDAATDAGEETNDDQPDSAPDNAENLNGDGNVEDGDTATDGSNPDTGRDVVLNGDGDANLRSATSIGDEDSAPNEDESQEHGAKTDSDGESEGKERTSDDGSQRGQISADDNLSGEHAKNADDSDEYGGKPGAALGDGDDNGKGNSASADDSGQVSKPHDDDANPPAQDDDLPPGITYHTPHEDAENNPKATQPSEVISTLADADSKPVGPLAGDGDAEEQDANNSVSQKGPADEGNTEQRQTHDENNKLADAQEADSQNAIQGPGSNAFDTKPDSVPATLEENLDVSSSKQLNSDQALVTIEPNAIQKADDEVVQLATDTGVPPGGGNPPGGGAPPTKPSSQNDEVLQYTLPIVTDPPLPLVVPVTDDVDTEEQPINESDSSIDGQLRLAVRGLNDIESTVARPSGFREGIRDDVFEQAKDPDGFVRDPLTGKIVDPDQPWDMGHKPGYEFRKHQVSAIERDISRNEFLDEHNNPDHYQPELPSSNRSHKGEILGNKYFGP